MPQNKTKKKSSTAKIAAPPPQFSIFEKHKIDVPKKITPQVERHLQNGINHLLANNAELPGYLDYVANHCQNFLLPYMSDGKQRQNDFYVILKPEIIDKVLAGELEDRKCH